MKKMAKVLTFLMCAALAFTFWGCENPASIDDSEDTTNTKYPAPQGQRPTGQGENHGSNEETVIPEEYKTPLTFEAIQDGDIHITNPWTTLKYSIDGGELQTIQAETDQYGDLTASISVQEGQKVSFYADGSENVIEPDAYFLNFGCHEDEDEPYFYVYGNVMSLLDSVNYSTKKDIDDDFALAYLFDDGYVRLINHPQKDIILPATSLKPYCYAGMFCGCESIERAPLLPATNLAEGCYAEMFQACRALIEAPELPATTLVKGCYSEMFDSCDSLTRAPVLPAQTLVESCYEGMFEWCDSLAYVKCLATNIEAEDCTTDWLWNVPDTGTFVKANGANWSRDKDGIPANWTIEGEHTITVTGGVASVNGQPVTKAEAGVEVTVTANTPETGKEFDVWLYDPEILNENNEYNSRVTFTMPAENVTLEASYEDIYYSINVDSAIANGSLSVSSSAAYNQTVTITANPSEYYALNSVTVIKGETNITVNGNDNTRTFIMPAGDVTISATFRITPIGTKKRPTEVGDIVFNDGTALPATEYADRELTDREKQNAIAVVGYVKTNDYCITVGLKQEYTELCTSDSQGNTNTTDFSNVVNRNDDKSAADVRDNICNGDGSITDYSQNLYPAFYWAQHYTGYNNLGNITNDWLVPNLSDFLFIYTGKNAIENAISKIGTDYSMPFINPDNSEYFTVTQHSTVENMVYLFNLNDGSYAGNYKGGRSPVLVIRYFYCGN